MEENKEKSILKNLIEWSLCVLFAIVIALIIRYYFITPTEIKQKSMNPTLIENEKGILSRINRTKRIRYKRGDIVTFEEPDEIKNQSISDPVAKYTDKNNSIIHRFIHNVLELNKINYIKRVIAIEGDTIKIENGKVFVNNEELKEEYLEYGTTTDRARFNELTVPEGYVFVMGDNRNQSYDSRNFGCIPVNRIEGKVVLRYWPFNKWGKIE